MLRWIFAVSICLVVPIAMLVASPAGAGPLLSTDFSIDNADFRNYFDHRGGARVLGHPISREFVLLGARVQLFQRSLLHLRPDGSVGPLDICGDELFPYVQVGGLTLPALDPEVVRAAPSPADPDFVREALAFLRANAPDSWEGMETRFYSTFAGTVGYGDAFPDGDAPESLVPLINLEMWGFPISKPARDPSNHEFVYLRFQRGILHFNRSAGHTSWLPVGEYLKALLTGRDLPPDLDRAAMGGRLHRQYDNGRPEGVANPSALPRTSMFAAFERDGVVVSTPMPAATPSAVPVPPTAAPVAPEASPPLEKPDWIEVRGSEWFVDQTNYALALLPDTTRDFVWMIVEVSDRSRFDIPNRTLYVTEMDAFIPGWREHRDAQILWYAGWIAHVTVHAEQHWTGRPTTGLAAEREAWLRQKEVLIAHDNTEGLFSRILLNVINRGNLDFGDWARP